MVARGEILHYIRLMKMMFYGYNRSPKDAPDGCDRVWLDDDKSGRQQRGDMLTALRPGEGDVVIVMARGDLGRGAEVPAIERAISERGAALEVREPGKPPSRPRGRPAEFTPTPEQDAKIAALWHSFTYKPKVLADAREICPGVSWDQMRRRYGRRWE